MAAEADVSISTVSLFLQGRPGVGDDTARRIAAAVDKLGYKPRSRSPGERAQNGTEHVLVGLLMEELSLSTFPTTVYGEIIRAVEAAAQQRGYSMVLSTTSEEGLPPMVAKQQVGGVIILGGSPTNDAIARELGSRKIPLVLLDNYIDGLDVDAIVPDNFWGGYRAVEHLAQLGHQRIAIIEGPPRYRTLTDRLWGALRAIEECQISLPPEYRQSNLSNGVPKKGYLEMKQLLSLPTPPTAVFAISDKTAFGALEAIREAGLCVPEELSLVGFDNTIDSAHFTPPLTTVELPGRKMGTLAVEQLAQQIQGKRSLAVRSNVYARLIVRASTAAPAA